MGKFCKKSVWILHLSFLPNLAIFTKFWTLWFENLQNSWKIPNFGKIWWFFSQNFSILRKKPAIDRFCKQRLNFAFFTEIRFSCKIFRKFSQKCKIWQLCQQISIFGRMSKIRVFTTIFHFLSNFASFLTVCAKHLVTNFSKIFQLETIYKNWAHFWRLICSYKKEVLKHVHILFV